MSSAGQVVLHPSLGRPGSDFDDLAGRLTAAGFDVIRVRPRGIDGRDLGGKRYPTLQDMAADVLEAMSGIEAEVHLIGHALGNRVMRCMATDHPERVRSVTLLAAGGRIAGDDEAMAAVAACFDRSLPDDARLAAMRTAFFAPGNDVPSAWRTGWHATAARQQIAALARTPLEHWWAGGRAPMLVVQGLQDRVAPPANGRALCGNRAGSTLVEIDGAGHALLPEQPAAVADAVLTFFTTL